MGPIGVPCMGPLAEFKLKRKPDIVPKGRRSQVLCNVIYQKVYLIKLINVSGFLSN